MFPKIFRECYNALMTWASRRQISYIFFLLMFLLGVGYLIVYQQLNKTPTCFDSKQNGSETGVDCGGSCVLACTAQVDKVSIIWSRVFKVVDGRYNAVAYLENHNKNIAVAKIKYKFKFSDKNNIYVGSREGETYVPPTGKFAVFEPAIGFGNAAPVYTTFEFTEVPVWVQVKEELINQVKVFVLQNKLENEDVSPVLSATVKNNSLFRIPDISFVAVLYDDMGNAINVSHTYVDVLFGKESKTINFTWPEPFAKKVTTIEIIPIFNIFSVKLK